MATTLLALDDTEPAHARAIAFDELLDRLEAEVRRKDEELQRNELLGARLGGLRERARAREAPDDDAGDAFDDRVDAERDERDGTRQDAREDGDAALQCHPAEAEPRQELARRVSRRYAIAGSREALPAAALRPFAATARRA
jgi:hypothetical protein